MKKALLIIMVCLPFILAAQQSTYSRVKVFTDDKSPAQLFATGIDFTLLIPKINGTWPKFRRKNSVDLVLPDFATSL